MKHPSKHKTALDLKRLHVEQAGSVTIFLVMGFFTMILLIGLFIDLARIKAAQNHLRRAVDASSRSVLADYNTKLRSGYALFGAGSSNANKDFQKYLLINFPAAGVDRINLMDYKYEGSNMVLFQSLQDSRVLKQQILETMKYKAPVEITRELINKFMQVSQVAGFFDQTNDQRKSLNRVDEKIKSIHESNEKIKESGDRLEDLKVKLKNLKKQIQLEQDEKKLKKLLEEKRSIEKETKKIRSSIDQELHKAKRASLEMELELKKVSQSKQSDLYQKDTSDRPDNPANKELQTQSKTVQEEIQNTVISKKKVLEDIKTEIDRTKEILKDEANGKEIKKNTWTLGIESASKAFEAINTSWQSTINSGQEQVELERHYEQLKRQHPEIGKYFKIYPINTEIGSFEKKNGEKTESIAEFFKSVFAIINVQETFIRNRDEIFLNEYILTYFSYMTSVPKGELLYPYRTKEAEYICFGKDYERKAVTELYFTRFALDSAGYFAFTPGIPSLTARTIYSLIMGAYQGAVDTFTLLALNQPVPLATVSPKNPLQEITLTYKDHLRLFLLLHSDESAKLNRIKEVINRRSGIQLEKHPTVAAGTATLSIKMWFLPLAGIKSLEQGPFGTRINNGRCYITKDVEFGY